jgi:hypothetical protein
VSRPRTDRLELVERVAQVLRAEPDATANTVHGRVGGRRHDVLRAVRVLRAVGTPPERPEGRDRWFPLDESGQREPSPHLSWTDDTEGAERAR